MLERLTSSQSLQATAGPFVITTSPHAYEVRPRKDKRGVDLISDALPFGRLWYSEPNAISYATFSPAHLLRAASLRTRFWAAYCIRRLYGPVAHVLQIFQRNSGT